MRVVQHTYYLEGGTCYQDCGSYHLGTTHFSCKAFQCLSLHNLCGISLTPLVYRRGWRFVGEAEGGVMAPCPPPPPWVRHWTCASNLEDDALFRDGE